MNGQDYGILAVIMLPIVGGVLSFLAGKVEKKMRNRVTNGMMFLQIGVLLYFAHEVISRGSEMSASLLQISKLQVSFELDQMRLLLCGLVTIVFAIMFWFMEESLRKEEHSNRFYLVYTIVYTMVMAAFMTNSLFNYSVFMVLVFLFLYPLIIHRKEEAARKNARIYLAFLVVMMVFVVAGCALLLVQLGDTKYGILYAKAMAEGYGGAPLLAGVFIMIAFFIAAGVFPVQFLITRGSSYSLMEASAILAGVASKLGVLGLMIQASNMFLQRTFFGRTLLALSLATIVWGLIITFSSSDIRKIIMGLNVATNGFNVLAICLMVLCGDSNGYAARSSIFMLFASSMSLLALYMVALEQVRKMHTFEIKGLISSGRENKCMAIVCLIACASIAGVPGTAGFLAHSLMYKTLLVNLKWKWLVVMYVIMWIFLATAAARIFMKLFVSTREKTLRIMTAEGEAVNMQKEDYAERLIEADKTAKNPYLAGEVLLLLLGLTQVLTGLFPHQFFDCMAEAIVEYSNGEKLLDIVPYYTSDVLCIVAVVAVASVLLYVNLIHGILLRTIRNKKNQELQNKELEKNR